MIWSHFLLMNQKFVNKVKKMVDIAVDSSHSNDVKLAILEVYAGVVGEAPHPMGRVNVLTRAFEELSNYELRSRLRLTKDAVVSIFDQIEPNNSASRAATGTILFFTKIATMD